MKRHVIDCVIWPVAAVLVVLGLWFAGQQYRVSLETQMTQNTEARP